MVLLAIRHGLRKHGTPATHPLTGRELRFQIARFAPNPG
jgi:hypothetical protein